MLDHVIHSLIAQSGNKHTVSINIYSLTIVVNVNFYSEIITSRSTLKELHCGIESGCRRQGGGSRVSGWFERRVYTL
jgi:hypothetical protein